MERQQTTENYETRNRLRESLLDDRSERLLPLAASLILMPALVGCHNSSDDTALATGQRKVPLVLTDATFHQQVIESKIPTLVDLWAPWCQPCIEMKPTLREIADELHGQVKVGELNIEDNPFITEKYGVGRYPMLLVFVDGQEVERLDGPQSKQSLSRILREYISEVRR